MVVGVVGDRRQQAVGGGLIMVIMVMVMMVMVTVIRKMPTRLRGR